MFQVTEAEKAEVVANCDHLLNLKYSPNKPFVFTEHGALMAASVLNTPRAIEVSVFVIRAFVKLREWALAHKEITRKLADLERKVGVHDEAIQNLIAAIRQLMTPTAEAKPKRRIGFQTAD